MSLSRCCLRIIRRCLPSGTGCREEGALNAAMSGSGPTVFGLFREEETARQAARTLEQTWPETFVAQPVGKLSDQKDFGNFF